MSATIPHAAPTTYERATYDLCRFELVAPAVRNDGAPSGYRDSVRELLAAAGFTGWSEVDSVGFWHGKLEPGTTFVLYAPQYQQTEQLTLQLLADIGRRAMPDQDAVQAVQAPGIHVLTEG